MNRITLRSQDEATGLVCPFLSRTGTGVVNCLTTKCMLWSQIDHIRLRLIKGTEIDKSKEDGYCGVG